MTTQSLTKAAAESLYTGQTVTQSLTKAAAESLYTGQTVTQSLAKACAETICPNLASTQVLAKLCVEVIYRHRPVLLPGQGWAVKITPVFNTMVALHVSGRESRASRWSSPLLEIELTFDVLRMDVGSEYQILAGFYASVQGSFEPFSFIIDPAMGLGSVIDCRFADDQMDLEEFMSRLWSVNSVKLRQVKSE